MSNKASKRQLATRIICAILALLMIGSIAYTAVFFIMNA